MPPRLLHLDLQVTHRCNLRCSYCYAHPAPCPDMAPATARRAIDFLIAGARDAPRVHLGFWGGEPFLCRDLLAHAAAYARAAARAAGKELVMGATTNATLLDAGARALAREAGIELTLSVDGGPEACAARRTPDGAPAWPLIAERLDELAAENPRRLPPVRMTVMPERAAHLDEDVAYLLSRRVRQVSFLPASGVAWTGDAMRAFEEGLSRVADAFIAWIREERPFPPYYPHLLRRLTVLLVKDLCGTLPSRAGTCGAGTSLLAVDTDGSLLPCHRVAARVPHPRDLRLGSLAEGVTNLALQNRLAALARTTGEVRCAACAWHETCAALCPALNHAQGGDIAAVPDHACFINRTLGQAAARIHHALAAEPNYRAYLEPFLAADPDERVLGVIAALQADPNALAARIADALGIENDREDSPP